MSDYTQIIINEVDKLLELLQISAEVSVEKEEDYYRIQIDTEETGVLIGYHGETLTSIQLILSQILFKKAGEWVQLTVNIGDYLDQREEQLRRMAEKAVEQAVEEKKSVTLPFLNAKERRLIHIFLKENNQVQTESIGEQSERRLVVFPV